MLRFFRRKERKDLPPEPKSQRELHWPLRMILKLRFNPFAGRVFFHDIICMMAKMASVDGPVNEIEMRVYTQLLEREFSLSERQKQRARKILFEASHSNKTFSDFAREFYRYFRKEPAILENAVDVLLSMVYADNRVSLGEQKLMAEVAEIFELSAETIDRLMKYHHNDKTFTEKPIEKQRMSGKEYEQYRKHEEQEQQKDRQQQHKKREERSERTKQPPVKPSSDVWFMVLQVNPYDPHDAIKKKYRKLVLQYHPDKLPSTIPEDMKRASTERFIAIQNAYEQYLSLGRGKR